MSTTTTTPVTVTAADIDRDRFDLADALDGQGVAMAATGLYAEVFAPTVDPDAGTSAQEFAFEHEVVDPAVAEVLPQVRDLLVAAIERRLPWTSTPENPQ